MKEKYVSLQFMGERQSRMSRGFISLILLLVLQIPFLIFFSLINISVDYSFSILILFVLFFYVGDLRIGLIENILLAKKKHKNFKLWFGIMDGYYLTRKQAEYLEKNNIEFQKGMFTKQKTSMTSEEVNK